MPRPKKEQYEYVPALGRYRKRVKDVDGVWMALYGKTPHELEDKIRAAREQIREGLVQRARPLTVTDYAERWIDLNTGDLAEAYRSSRVSAIRNHVEPVIGALKLEDVKQDDCRRVLKALDGRSASLRQKVLGAMRAVFRAALANDLIRKDPTADLKAGGKPSAPKEALTPAQVAVLEDAVRGTRVETFVLLALYAGLRREEALALRWECIDLSSPVPALSVRRALRWEHSHPVVSEELKSSAAFRTIPLPPQLLAHLLAVRRSSGYVFGGETPLSQTQWRNLWRFVRARQTGEATYREGGEKRTFVRELGAKSRGADFRYSIDFDVTPHQLRHTYCTNLILAGANVKRVQYLMGHADPQVTLKIYAHVLEHAPEVMAVEVAKAFGVIASSGYSEG